MFAWAAAGLATGLAIPLTIWASYAALVVRVGATVDAIVRIRRARVNRLEWSLLGGVASGAGVAAIVYLKLVVRDVHHPGERRCTRRSSIGDHIFVERLTLQWRPPERGEVIVFRQPCQPDRDYVKRVMAVADDTIEVRCNVVYVNGAAVPSELVQGADCDVQGSRRDAGSMDPRQCSRYRETLDGRSYEMFHDVERPARDEALRRNGGLEIGDGKDFPQRERCSLRSCSSNPSMRGRGIAGATARPARRDQARRARRASRSSHFVVPPDSLFVMGDNRNERERLALLGRRAGGSRDRPPRRIWMVRRSRGAGAALSDHGLSGRDHTMW